MNKMRLTPKNFFWLVFILLLAACGPSTKTVTSSETVDINAASTQIAGTVVAQLKQTTAAQPTIPLGPTASPSQNVSATPSPTSAQTPRPTSKPLPFVTLAGLRVAYTLKGNLYIQDSGKEPVQLTNSGKDSYPNFSDDGQLLWVYRKPDFYLINADGSGERELTFGKLLTNLGLGYTASDSGYSPTFVPGTHELLLQAGDGDLLIFDPDRNQLRSLFPPGSQVKYFKVSPNGKLALVWAADELDAISLDGKSKQRLTDYPPDGRILIYQPEMHWSQDSSKVTLILSQAKEQIFGMVQPFIIRQYYLDGRRPVETRLKPPLVNVDGPVSYQVSPDGNWVVYSYCNDFTQTDTPKPDGAYLGNLQAGTMQQIINSGCPYTYYWNPDSIRFIVDDTYNAYLGNIRGGVTLLETGWGGGSWLDGSHYGGAIYIGEIGKKGMVQVIKLTSELKYPDAQNFTFIFVNPK